MKQILLYMVFHCICSICNAQANKDSIKREIERINHNYDNASYIAFDADIILSSDTVLGYYDRDKQWLKFILNGSSYYYATAEAEFLQDDTLSVTAYRNEHSMIVAPRNKKVSNSLPLNGFKDSALYFYFLHYDATITELSSGDREINIFTDSVWAMYRKITIRYNPVTYYLSYTAFKYNDLASANPRSYDTLGAPLLDSLPTLSKKLEMHFHSYRFVTGDDIIHHRKYVFFDRIRKRYVATGAYKGYRVITTGLSHVGSYLNDPTYVDPSSNE